MMFRAVLLISFLSASFPFASWGECQPIPGAAQIWSNSHTQWVLVGEIHGSNETPAAFADLVCDALARGRAVTVGLERPSVEQRALESLLTADDVDRAKNDLLRQPAWTVQGQDGRASGAMLELMFKLRALHSSYPALNLEAFDVPASSDSAGARDKAMGKALLSLGRSRPHDLILVLTGNAHIFEVAQFGYPPMATYLPADQKLSIEVTNSGGQFWTLTNGGCGATENGAFAKGGDRPRGVILDPALAPYGKVDGILSLGGPATASSPAAGAIRPLTECRKKFLELHSSGAAGAVE